MLDQEAGPCETPLKDQEGQCQHRDQGQDQWLQPHQQQHQGQDLKTGQPGLLRLQQELVQARAGVALDMLDDLAVAAALEIAQVETTRMTQHPAVQGQGQIAAQALGAILM